MPAYRYRLPLKKPITLDGREYIYREGILLEEKGCWAEASPLPGFNRESIEEVAMALRGEGPTPPSLAFALDSLKTPMTSCCVPASCLLQGEASQILEVAEAIGRTVCSSVKLKVGRSDIQSDIKLVRQVRERLRLAQQLRLDANQAWSLDDAVSFANGVKGEAIEYIEEPLQDSSQCELYFARAGVPYALDETLAHKTLASKLVDQFPNASALVCKPTILGGRSRIEQLAATGKPIVFSAAFESGVGIARITQLAKEFSPDIPAGLDTYSWLDSDVLTSRLSIRDGHFHVPAILNVDLNGLEEVAR